MDSQMLFGVLDLLILDVLDRGPNYGYAITQLVLSQSAGTFEIKEGSLYPALHRLERKKLLASEWAESHEGRPRKYYRLAPAGRKALEAKRAEWMQFANGVNGVLRGRHEMA